MADKPTTFMCRLSWNLGASTFWNPQGLSRAVMGLLYFYIFKQFSPIYHSLLGPNSLFSTPFSDIPKLYSFFWVRNKVSHIKKTTWYKTVINCCVTLIAIRSYFNFWTNIFKHCDLLMWQKCVCQKPKLQNNPLTITLRGRRTCESNYDDSNILFPMKNWLYAETLLRVNYS